MRRCAGLTAIELVTVLAVAAILATMSVPGMLRLMHRSQVQRAADDLVWIHRQAQQLARRHDAVPGKWYGVALVAEDGRAHAVVTWGSADTDVLTADDDRDGAPDPGGRPFARRDLPQSAVVRVDTGSGLAPLSGRLGWFYQYRTGRPMQPSDPTTAIDIGTAPQPARPAVRATTVAITNEVLIPSLPDLPGSPVCSALEVAGRDGRYRMGVAIYAVGLEATGPRP